MEVLVRSICEGMGCFGSRLYDCREEESEFEREERERGEFSVGVCLRSLHCQPTHQNNHKNLNSNWFRTKFQQP